MPNLKQGTLSFATAKQTNTTLNGKSEQRTPETGKNKRVEIPADVKAREVLDICSDEEGIAGKVTLPVKRTRASTKRRISSGNANRALSQPSRSEKQKPFPAGIEKHLDVEDKAGRYCKYYDEVRAKTGHVYPIHSEGQNRIHHMLRFFDMSYEFGPCIGMTRLERWERAESLGLNPPAEVRDILLTKEGIEYAQCVLDSEV